MQHLVTNVSVWVDKGEGPGSVGCLKELWVKFSPDVACIRISKRNAMRPTKAGQFDITSSKKFLRSRYGNVLQSGTK